MVNNHLLTGTILQVPLWKKEICTSLNLFLRLFDAWKKFQTYRSLPNGGFFNGDESHGIQCISTKSPTKHTNPRLEFLFRRAEKNHSPNGNPATQNGVKIHPKLNFPYKTHTTEPWIFHHQKTPLFPPYPPIHREHHELPTLAFSRSRSVVVDGGWVISWVGGLK